MDVTKEKLAELKAAHGTVYEGSITYKDRNDELQKVEFIFREPTNADAEITIQGAAKNPLATNQNLLASLIVHPEPMEVVQKVRDYPLAIGNFVEKVVVPFSAAATAPA
jgi:hypothetical protein